MAAKDKPLRAAWRKKRRNSDMKQELNQSKKSIHEKTELKKNNRKKKSKKKEWSKMPKLTVVCKKCCILSEAVYTPSLCMYF